LPSHLILLLTAKCKEMWPPETTWSLKFPQHCLQRLLSSVLWGHVGKYIGTNISEEHAAYLSRKKRSKTESSVYTNDTLDMFLPIYQATLHPEESNIQLKQCTMKVIRKLGIQYTW
jgi:hypothetical protein